MPKAAFLGSRVTAEDRALAAVIRTHRSGHCDNVSRYLRQLESFMQNNHFRRSVSNGEIFELFATQWVRKKRAPATIQNVVSTLERFRVDPRNLAPTRDRIAREAFRNGLKRYATSQGRKFIRRISTKPMPYVSTRRPACLKESEAQAFWALLCATGNRPDNVYRARAVIATSLYVEVCWGLRKVNNNVYIRYDYKWSATPPEWIQKRWNDLYARPWWPRSKPRNIASLINTWLRKTHNSKLSSTSPRERLDHHLRGLVAANLMNEAVYTRIIDHKLTTSLDHYASGQWITP